MTEEKGPHCSLTQNMLDRYLPDAVSLHKQSLKYFMTEMTQEEFETLKKDNSIESYTFNKIRKNYE